MVMAQGAHSSFKPVSLLPPISLASLHCCSLPTCLGHPCLQFFLCFFPACSAFFLFCLYPSLPRKTENQPFLLQKGFLNSLS